jgi:hypothetical protein
MGTVTRSSLSTVSVLNVRNSNFIKSAVSGSFFLIGLFNSCFEASTMILTISATHGSDKPELSNSKANNITFHEEYVYIFIEKSKTDCYRNGKHVLIAKLNTPQCLVTILQCYIL